MPYLQVMVTNIMKYCHLVIISLAILLNPSCKKHPPSCAKLGLEFTYTKPGVIYSPGSDSIPLGSDITLEASAPITFFDDSKQYNVTINSENILGPITASKATGNVTVPTAYAIDDLVLTATIGKIIKDTVQFTTEQLKGARTVYWQKDLDSFRLKISIKPNIRGVFFIGLGQQGNRDTDCALYKYFLRVKNYDQHLYFLSQLYGGYLDDNSRNYAYCFKVY